MYTREPLFLHQIQKKGVSGLSMLRKNSPSNDERVVWLPIEMTDYILILLLPEEEGEGAVLKPDAVMAFFSLLLVDKRRNAWCEKYNVDWFLTLYLVGDGWTPAEHSRWILDRGALELRQLTACLTFLKAMRTELDHLREKHNLLYHSKSGRVYKQRIGVPKMGRIKINDPVLAKRFKALVRRHTKLNKEKNRISREIRDGLIRPLLLM